MSLSSCLLAAFLPSRVEHSAKNSDMQWMAQGTDQTLAQDYRFKGQSTANDQGMQKTTSIEDQVLFYLSSSGWLVGFVCTRSSVALTSTTTSAIATTVSK